MIPLIEYRLSEVAALCRQFGVQRLDLFGSAAAGNFDPASSDLDFVAAFSDTRAPGYADRYLHFAEALESLFQRPVDVITERSMRSSRFRQAVDAARQKVYDERDDAKIA